MKKYNSLLAVLCLTGFVGLNLSRLPLASLAGMFFGSYFVAAYTVGNNVIDLASLAIIILALVAIFKPNNVLTYVACGIELLLALLCMVSPTTLLILYNVSEDILSVSASYLTISGLIMLIVSVACIALRFVMKKVNIKQYLIIIIAGTVLSVILPYIFSIYLYMGAAGVAFSTIVQPIATVMPMVLLNSKSNLVSAATSATVSTPIAASKYAYLDEYKRKMKGE